MPYEVALPRFSGPIEKLLELIEEKKLEVTGVSLAQVTDEFLRYAQTLREIEPSLLADFISVASHLVLLKSKSLLPSLSFTDEEEAQIKGLERRVRFYRDLKPAMRVVAALFRGGTREFARQYFLNTAHLETETSSQLDVFYPGGNLTVSALSGALEGVCKIVQALTHETQEIIRERVATVEEKVAEIVERLGKSRGSLSFGAMAQEQLLPEIVALFLAVLHLAHQRLVFLEQEKHFSDIIITKYPKQQ
jgi:segregation and condensation protein A